MAHRVKIPIVPLDRYAELVQWGVVKRSGDGYALNNMFKSELSANVEKFRNQMGLMDDGPALVQTLIEASGKSLSKQQIFDCLYIIVPMIRLEMGGVFIQQKVLKLTDT